MIDLTFTDRSMQIALPLISSAGHQSTAIGICLMYWKKLSSCLSIKLHERKERKEWDDADELQE